MAKNKQLKLSEFAYMNSTKIGLVVTDYGPDGNHEYIVDLVAWVESGEAKEFPVVLSTQIGTESLKIALKFGSETALVLCGCVLDSVDILNADGDIISTVSLDDFFDDEDCDGCSDCDCDCDCDKE